MPYKDAAAKRANDRARYQRMRDTLEYQARVTAYREANRDRQKELSADWYSDHAETLNEQRRGAYAENPEPLKAKSKAYYHARKSDSDYQDATRAKRRRHQETGMHCAWQRTYRRRNREKLNRAAKLRRARKFTTQVELIDPEKVYARDKWMCRLCGERTAPNSLFVAMRPTVDHIVPLSLGGSHTYDNVQTAHWACNSRKGNRVEVVGR